jgi:hypothetical protein
MARRALGRDTRPVTESANVKALTDIYERWSEGEFRSTADLFDSHVLFVMGDGLPEAGTYLGAERLAEYTRGFLEPWAQITIEAEETPRRGTPSSSLWSSAAWAMAAGLRPSCVTSTCGRSGAAG